VSCRLRIVTFTSPVERKDPYYSSRQGAIYVAFQMHYWLGCAVGRSLSVVSRFPNVALCQGKKALPNREPWRPYSGLKSQQESRVQNQLQWANHATKARAGIALELRRPKRLLGSEAQRKPRFPHRGEVAREPAEAAFSSQSTRSNQQSLSRSAMAPPKYLSGNIAAINEFIDKFDVRLAP